jgi:3-polyprenyl-4-hydroxybenzoate decarboxylase
VVDPDVDIFSDEQMDWAFATRFQADRDLVIESGLRTLSLDPSLEKRRVGSKAGFDLTWPFGSGERLERTVPEVPKYQGPRFPSIQAALEDGPKTFEGLMTALGTRDGREIVREVANLKAKLGIVRDEIGRYSLGRG